MNEKVKEQDVLLVKEKKSGKLYAAGMDKEGKINSTKPEDNPDFLRIDRQGNMLENFFANFMRQVKNPTSFEFLRVPAEKFQEVYEKLKEAFRNPDKKENKAFIEMYRVNPEDYLKKQEKNHAIDPELVQWDKFEKFGIRRDTLEKTDNVDKMLDHRKTDMLNVTLIIDDETTVRTDARFSLRKQDDGSFAPVIHPIRHKPDLDRPYFGVQFSPEDKQNLLNTGNLGRVAEAEYRQGEKTPVFLSIDRQTNELVAFRADKLRVPETMKGVELTEKQKKELAEGKAVYIENMTSKKGEPFSSSVQFNSDKRSFEFIFDNEEKQNQKRSQRSQQSQSSKDVPKTFRKKELTNDQRDSLREGKTVYVDGLTDKKGKSYSGYITMNKETGKTDFMFPKDYKEAVANGSVIPDDRHKTQVKVNSEGKTNESTKNVKDPLEKGQTQPTEKQQEKQAVKKPKGNKVSF